MSEDSAIVTPSLLRQWPLPEPGNSKHGRGHVVVIGGARATPGAALLAGIASLRVGAGVLAMVVPDEVAVPLAVAIPEALVTGWTGDARSEQMDWDSIDALLDTADAVAVGPGIDDADIAKALVTHVAAATSSIPVLLDAYALGVLPGLADAASALAGRLVLTPNQTEAGRLLDADVETSDDANRAVAHQIAQRWRAIVSYNGAIAEPDGAEREICTGHAGLGTSGSGDVLAGAIAGLLARGTEPLHAACWGTYLHAAAGDRLAARVGRLGFLARELLDELPLVLTELHA